jgi:hypothetical protein
MGVIRIRHYYGIQRSTISLHKGNRVELQQRRAQLGPARNSGDKATGRGDQRLVRPNGTVLLATTARSSLRPAA